MTLAQFGAGVLVVLVSLVLIAWAAPSRPRPRGRSGMVTHLLVLETVTTSGRLFAVRRPVDYCGSADPPDTWTIPAGFVTDLGSVPEALTWLVARYGDATAAYVLHDLLCRIAAGEYPSYVTDGTARREVVVRLASGPGGVPLNLGNASPQRYVSRRDADGILRRELRAVGFSWPRAYLVWTAVRLGGTLRGDSRPQGWEALQLAACSLLAVPLLLPALPVLLWQRAFALVERITR